MKKFSEQSKELVGEIPDVILKRWDIQNACKAACNKIVKEVIKHWEDAEIQEQAMWDEVISHFGFSQNDGFIFQREGSQIYKIRQVDKELDSLISKTDFYNQVRGIIKEEFAASKKPE